MVASLSRTASTVIGSKNESKKTRHAAPGNEGNRAIVQQRLIALLWRDALREEKRRAGRAVPAWTASPRPHDGQSRRQPPVARRGRFLRIQRHMQRVTWATTAWLPERIPGDANDKAPHAKGCSDVLCVAVDFLLVVAAHGCVQPSVQGELGRDEVFHAATDADPAPFD